MKRIKKDPSVGFWILFVLLALIVFAVLELNKNSLFGFFEAALILIVYNQWIYLVIHTRE